MLLSRHSHERAAFICPYRLPGMCIICSRLRLADFSTDLSQYIKLFSPSSVHCRSLLSSPIVICTISCTYLGRHRLLWHELRPRNHATRRIKATIRRYLAHIVNNPITSVAYRITNQNAGINNYRNGPMKRLRGIYGQSSIRGRIFKVRITYFASGVIC